MHRRAQLAPPCVSIQVAGPTAWAAACRCGPGPLLRPLAMHRRAQLPPAWVRQWVAGPAACATGAAAGARLLRLARLHCSSHLRPAPLVRRV